MKKKILSVFLVVSFGLISFTGCGNKNLSEEEIVAKELTAVWKSTPSYKFYINGEFFSEEAKVLLKEKTFDTILKEYPNVENVDFLENEKIKITLKKTTK